MKQNDRKILIFFLRKGTFHAVKTSNCYNKKIQSIQMKREKFANA